MKKESLKEYKIYASVEKMILKFSHKFPEYLKEEAKSIATEKLFQLYRNFDPRKNVKFSTYFQSHLNFLGSEIYRENFLFSITSYSWKKRYNELKNKNKTDRKANKNLEIRSIENFDKVKKEQMNLKMNSYSLEWEEVNQNLDNLLNQLPDEQKKIVLLYFGFLGKKHNKKEIAEMLNLTPLRITKLLNQSINFLISNKDNLYIPEENDR
jgi:RNA polymerase sigma factor (sigma-70 family)